jgi:hypothetical protein
MISKPLGDSSSTEDVEHDPFEVATLFARKIATRERHVCFLLGAGASRSAGLPDMAGLKSQITEKLGAHTAASPQNVVHDPDIVTDADLNLALETRSIEQALTWLRKIAALLDEESDTVGGLNKAKARALDKKLSNLIMTTITESNYELAPFLDLAKWLRSTSYSRAVEIFTLNYDLLMEFAFENLGMPYFDGFTGVYEGRFRPDLVDGTASSGAEVIPNFFHRLWKMHGSISWTRNERGEIVRLGKREGVTDVAAIHPSESKYEDSRRAPFVILQDRLRRSLFEQETLLVTAGYSFGDQHINEVIFDAIQARPRSEFVFTHYDEVPKEAKDIALGWRNVTLLGPTFGIVGGEKGNWASPDPSKKRASVWQDGKFQLGNFSRLSAFLSESAPPEASAAVEPKETLKS